MMRLKIKRFLKFFIVVAFLLLFLWNWFIALVLVVLLNVKNFYRFMRGSLPFPQDGTRCFGPYTYTYKKVEKIPYKMDVYYPGDEPRIYPVVFFAHGGGWISGFRRQPNYISWYRFLTAHGFAVVTIDYRYGYLHGIEEILDDYRDALMYIKEHHESLRLDTDSIVLMGLSAGGHLALYHAAFHTFHGNMEVMEGVRAVVAWYAPSDLMDLWSMEVESLFARFAVLTTLKGTPGKRKADYIRYSPITWISRKIVPVFLVHGAKDGVVPVRSSVKMYRKLKEHGVEAHLKIHPKGDHAFEFELRDRLVMNFLEEMVRFMRKAIRS